MGAAKKRLVRFYKSMVIDGDGNTTFVDDDFWDKFVEHVEGLPREDREARRNGKTLLGVGGDHARTSMRYLYLGKMRTPADYPDDFDSAGTSPTSLAFNTTIREIAEPAYIVPTGIKGTVAVLRTSSGPSHEDIEAWMSEVGKYATTSESFVLVPVVSERQWELLAQAELISKIEVRVDAEREANLATSGKVGAAIQGVMDLSDHEATLNFKLSFGHGIPDSSAGRRFTAEARQFIESGEYSKAVASLKIPNPDGTWRTESVDFIRELVTYQARVGDSDAEPLTPDLVLPEIQGAIVESREFLRQ